MKIVFWKCSLGARAVIQIQCSPSWFPKRYSNKLGQYVVLFSVNLYMMIKNKPWKTLKTRATSFETNIYDFMYSTQVASPRIGKNTASFEL